MIFIRRSIVWLTFCSALQVVVGKPALAHHSYSMFDPSRPAVISGTVRNLEWTNPHVWLWITVADDKGNPAIYAFEGTSPAEMNRRSGWTKGSVAFGDRVTVKYLPFKDSAKKGGRISFVTLPDGRTLGAAGGLASPPSVPAPHKQ